VVLNGNTNWIWLPEGLFVYLQYKEIKVMKFNTSVNVKYDKDKTILKCNKCGQEQIEWYNDQPGDPCSNYTPNCKGHMFRVIKTEVNEHIISVREFQNQAGNKSNEELHEEIQELSKNLIQKIQEQLNKLTK
jgi:hypothetical protein